MPLGPIYSQNIHMFYGNWTGPGYSADVLSPSFVPFTAQQEAVQGVDSFDAVSRTHDIAYNDAQQALLSDLRNSTVSGSQALRNYLTALQIADTNFVASQVTATASNAWGLTVQAVGTIVLGAKAAVEAAVLDRLQKDAKYAAAWDALANQYRSGAYYGDVVGAIGNFQAQTNGRPDGPTQEQVENFNSKLQAIPFIAQASDTEALAADALVKTPALLPQFVESAISLGGDVNLSTLATYVQSAIAVYGPGLGNVATILAQALGVLNGANGLTETVSANSIRIDGVENLTDQAKFSLSINPDGSSTTSYTKTLSYGVNVGNGAVATYSVDVQFSNLHFILAPARIGADATTTEVVNVSIVGGHLNPNSQNSVFLDAAQASTTRDTISTAYPTATLTFHISSGVFGFASGDFKDMPPFFPDVTIMYDGTSTTVTNIPFTVSGRRYARADAGVAVTGQSGYPVVYFHVGDAGASVQLTVTNRANGGLVDSLVVGAGTGVITAVSGDTTIATGQSSVLTASINTSTSGVFTAGADELTYTSHDPDLPDVTATYGGYHASVHIMQYAQPFLTASVDPNVKFAQNSATKWTLDFGYQIYGFSNGLGTDRALVDIQNGTTPNIEGDYLQGSLSGSGSGFFDSYALPLQGGSVNLASYIGPAGSIALGQFLPYTNQLGVQTETATYTPRDFNASGYSANLPAQTLVITSNVVSSSAVPVAMFEAIPARLDALSGGFAIVDTVAAMAQDLPALEADAHITAIHDSTGATVTLSGNTITARSSDGSKTVSTVNSSGSPYIARVAAYNAAGDLLTVKAYNSGNQLIATDYGSQIPNDFNHDGRTDLIFQTDTGAAATSGALATWELDDYAITGGGVIGSPGADWSVAGIGDFYGNGDSDILWRNQNGLLWVSDISGYAVVGGGGVGALAANAIVVGVGDFTGDGKSDILVENFDGYLYFLTMNGAAVSSYSNLGQLGSGWKFVGLGDFNNDGQSDLLVENSAGVYATWLLGPTGLVGGATLGQLGTDWVYKGVGDFNGNGDSDILFENATTGVYATWNVINDAVASASTIGAPGASWTLAGIGNYSSSGLSSLLFRNLQTGLYATWDVSGATVTGGAAVGNPGVNYPLLRIPAAAPAFAPTLVFKATGGTLATWTIANGAVTGVGTLGNPGAGWTTVAVGDFYGDGQSDILFENAANSYWVWRTNGQSVVGGGGLGALPGWTFKGLGDFNGDGLSDLLFRNDANGAYATWEMNGTSVVKVVTFGSPGAGFTYAGTGDFSGDGTSDLLFRDSSGDYWAWFVSGDAILAAGEIGNPGAGWSLKAIGDINGDGRADLVFANAGGLYKSWDLNHANVLSTAFIGTAEPQWSFVGMAELNPAHGASLLFEDSSGYVANWLLNDFSARLGGATIGQAAGFTVLAAR